MKSRISWRCFRAEERRRLRAVPLNQIWRDHLLAGSILLDTDSRWGEGKFVVLYPAQNDCVDTAVKVYSSCLLDASTFTTWTLEGFVEGLRAECDAGWAAELQERYLTPSRLQRSPLGRT